MKVAAIASSVQRGRTHVLAFRHPLAGKQLVKGTLRSGERPIAGALRELREESGLYARRGRIFNVLRHPNGPPWILVDVTVRAPQREFDHFCHDDGGHRFAYFWHPLARWPDASWHPVFRRALVAIRTATDQRRLS